jgi:mannose-6-phosphate isomerase-like protein (cupin superfamily)
LRSTTAIRQAPLVVPEAKLEETDHGIVPEGDEGWFVVNALEAPWWHADGRSAICVFESEWYDFMQFGININVLEPGVAMAMYHWEADQEGFLVLSGEALLVVEGEERALRQWDFVHCPPRTKHTIVGAGDGPCVVLAVGAREGSVGGPEENPGWGGYTVDETAQRHGAGVEEDTIDPQEAYARFASNKRTLKRYREGWLPR